MEHFIRAKFDEETITVYQAYNKEIAISAVNAQTFISPPYKTSRMTWIKPSFLWMMYRSGWATKENQEYILAIKIKRTGFEWALQNGCLSTFDKEIHRTYSEWSQTLTTSPVRIQWDPERDVFLRPLPYRTIQIGLSKEALEKFVKEWIISIEDITDHCKTIQELLILGQKDEAEKLLPSENCYQPILPALRHIKMSPYSPTT